MFFIISAPCAILKMGGSLVMATSGCKTAPIKKENKIRLSCVGFSKIFCYHVIFVSAILETEMIDIFGIARFKVIKRF